MEKCLFIKNSMLQDSGTMQCKALWNKGAFIIYERGGMGEKLKISNYFFRPGPHKISTGKFF